MNTLESYKDKGVTKTFDKDKDKGAMGAFHKKKMPESTKISVKIFIKQCITCDD